MPRPAAITALAAVLAALSGIDDAIGLDMGGTSCDVCVVEGGEDPIIEAVGGDKHEVSGRDLVRIPRQQYADAVVNLEMVERFLDLIGLLDSRPEMKASLEAAIRASQAAVEQSVRSQLGFQKSGLVVTVSWPSWLTTLSVPEPRLQRLPPCTGFQPRYVIDAGQSEVPVAQEASQAQFCMRRSGS